MTSKHLANKNRYISHTYLNYTSFRELQGIPTFAGVFTIPIIPRLLIVGCSNTLRYLCVDLKSKHSRSLFDFGEILKSLERSIRYLCVDLKSMHSRRCFDSLIYEYFPRDFGEI